MRLAPLLLLLPLTACIERTPTADDDPPFECAAVDCGRSPDLAPCADDSWPALSCVPHEGVCAWAVEACPMPEGEPEPPIVDCAPEHCGPIPDGGGCEAGFEAQYACVAGIDACGWQVSCEPIEPQVCGADECGAPPAGEPCGPAERSVRECRDTRNGCEWYFACEPIECAPSDCPPNPPQPNCEHTMQCVPIGGACEWLIECVPPICEQPWDAGPCLALQPMWWFNSATFECEMRDYGGCEGNENRFETEEACHQMCGVLGGEVPDEPGVADCVPNGEPWFVYYHVPYCLPDGDGDRDGDGLLPVDLQLVPGEGCAVAQLLSGGEVERSRALSADGYAQVQMLLDGVRDVALEPQDPDCNAWAMLSVVLDGDRTEYVVDRLAPPAELRGVHSAMDAMRDATINCTGHPFLAACE